MVPWLWLVSSLFTRKNVHIIYNMSGQCFVLSCRGLTLLDSAGQGRYDRTVWNLGSRFRVIPFGNNFLLFKVIIQISRWLCLFMHHIAKHNNGHSLVASLTGISVHSGGDTTEKTISTIFNIIFKEKKSCNLIIINKEGNFESWTFLLKTLKDVS